MSHSRKLAFQWLFKFQHVLLMWLILRVSRCESVASQVVKTTSLQILHQTLTHSPYIKSHKNIGKWLNKNTIKFDTKLKKKKKKSIVVYHNFAIIIYEFYLHFPLKGLYYLVETTTRNRVMFPLPQLYNYLLIIMRFKTYT